MPSRIHRLTIAFALAVLLVPRAASACDEAERLRLSDELQSLAQKNAWTGVERKYSELLRTKCDLKFEQYSLGSESAKNLGKTFEMWERLEGAKAIDPQEALDAALDQIESNYARIEIRGDARRRAPLLREEMPFPPDQRKSIEYAQSVVEGTGSFKGMLPQGEYKIADKSFTVEADDTGWQVIAVGKGRPPKPGPGGDDLVVPKRESLINWMGPIAVVGAGFFGSKAPRSAIYAPDDEPLKPDPIVGFDTPGFPCPDAEGQPNEERAVDEDGDGEFDACLRTIRTPETIDLFSTPSVSFTVGWEVGLTYKAPEAGVIGTVTYRRLFGNRLNQITLHVGAVVRPGDFRITAGPTWGVITGKGRGYATWADEGQGRNFRLDEQNYAGTAFGGGMAGSVGYAVFDVGPFQGLIELDGHWQRDNVRNYSGFGLRLGIVPKIDRFEG